MFDKLFHIKGREYRFLAIQYGGQKKKHFLSSFLLWLKGTNLLSSRGQAIFLFIESIFPVYRAYFSCIAGEGVDFSCLYRIFLVLQA
jgi:hypothetical protein